MKHYDELNAIRGRVLTLPVNHKLRVRYRDLRRGLANATEDIAATGATQLAADKHLTEIRRLVAAVEKKVR